MKKNERVMLPCHLCQNLMQVEVVCAEFAAVVACAYVEDAVNLGCRKYAFLHRG